LIYCPTFAGVLIGPMGAMRRVQVGWSVKRVADLEAALKGISAEFDESQKKAAAKIIADRAIHNSMFAMLARQDGK